MNGYNLIRDWYNYKFSNPSKVKAIHSDFYCYLIDRWNRLGQKKEFGLPTDVTMEALGIGSYNTYKKVLNDLVDFGFVNIVKKSINQHQSKIVAISKFDKALDKSLDEANNKAHDVTRDTIIKQENKETREQRNNISSSTKNEFSQDIIQTFNSVIGYFETKPQTESQKNKWLDCIDKLNRIDGLSFDEIIFIVKYAKEDNFWSKNFLSLLKLRNKNKEDIYFWNVFKTQMKPKQETNVSQNSHLKVYV